MSKNKANFIDKNEINILKTIAHLEDINQKSILDLVKNILTKFRQQKIIKKKEL